MKEMSISISIPRYREEQTILKECAHSLEMFLNLCENSPENICESNLKSFFDAYTRIEVIQQKLSSSEWPNGREFSQLAKACLIGSKSRFDELGICIQCEYDNDHIEMLKGFDQIRTAF